jgi:hypothetical protein
MATDPRRGKSVCVPSAVPLAGGLDHRDRLGQPRVKRLDDARLHRGRGVPVDGAHRCHAVSRPGRPLGGRPTICRALQDLRLKGLIETRQGKGAFVRMPSPLAVTLTAENYHRHQREGRPGFTAQVSEQGHTSHQDILEVATVPAPSEIAQRLGLDEDQDVVMRRLRMDTISHGEVVMHRFEIKL